MADIDFPYTLTVHIPFPSHRLAEIALRALSVDQELSSLVNRSFTLVDSRVDSDRVPQNNLSKELRLVETTPLQPSQHYARSDHCPAPSSPTILKTRYTATTNRMLRVAVNGFFESLGTVIQVMEELDLDVVHEKGFASLEGAQGVEQGMTGNAE